MWYLRIRFVASLSVSLACMPGLLTGCSGTTESSSQQSGDGGQAGSAGSGGCPVLGPADCYDPCTNHMYGPTCVGGAWTCTGPESPSDCPDGGQEGGATCPGYHVDCVNPCTNQMYGGTCVNGDWVCEGPLPSDCPDAAVDAPEDVKPDCPMISLDCWGVCQQPQYVDGCPVGCELAPGCVACGKFACKEAPAMCVQPMPPGICPDPESGQCPPGCPGCPAAEPSCATIPNVCKDDQHCDCIVKEFCPTGMGDCQPDNGGFRVQCTGAP